ncbi:MAG: hypothetical protein ABIR96_06910 [Bdellovibrionota bacterium]
MLKLSVLGILLGACAFSSSSKQRAQSVEADKVELATVEKSLHVGMSLQEVKEISPKTANCRGSKKSFMTCTGSFRVQGDRYLPTLPVGDVGDTKVALDPLGVGALPYKASKSETITLHFNKNKLERWESTIVRH